MWRALAKGVLGRYIAAKADPFKTFGDSYDSFSEKQSDINWL